jgi:ribose 5-phosphate isomerase B
MHVGIAADHGGFALKEDLMARLRAAGHDVVDFGADTLTPDDDYPDFVIPLAQAVAAGTLERGRRHLRQRCRSLGLRKQDPAGPRRTHP